MRNEVQFSAHKFDNLDNASFSPEEYSFLKFGCDDIAKKFGYELADSFYEAHGSVIKNQQNVVIPSPYNYVKNAATIMSEHFVNRLNFLLVTNGGTNLEWNTITRKVSYVKDYGHLDKATRQKLLEGDQFFMNRDALKGKNLILIDDVNITGTHEDKLKEILNQNKMTNNTYFLYYAKYTSKLNPEIEGVLNFAKIKTTLDFVHLTHQKNHHMIVRPIKFIMKLNPEEFEEVIKNMEMSTVYKIYNGCLAEGYHKIEEYSLNFNYLTWYLTNIKL